MACGEILTRLFARCNLEETKHATANEYANVQLSGGLRAGIEDNLHPVRAIWPQSAGWTVDAGLNAAEAALTLDEEDGQAEEMQ